MLSRLFESLLTRLINGAQDRREGAGVPAAPEPGTPDDFLLGEVLPPPGSVYGSPQDERWARLSRRDRLRHLYVIGAIGSGKTNCLMRLIDHDIARRQALCLIDLRGDLVDRVLARLAATPGETPATLGKRLVLIDLRADPRDPTARFVGVNPLDCGSGNGNSRSGGAADPHAQALQLLAFIKRHADSWGVQIDEDLRYCLLALALGGWTLLEIRPLLSDAAFRRVALQGVRDPDVLAFFDAFGRLSPDQQASRRAAVLNKVTPLIGLPRLRYLFGQRGDASVRFRTLFDRVPGAIVLVALAHDRLHGAAHLAGAFVVSALETALLGRVDIPEEQRIPVHLVVDEFANFVSNNFATVIAEGRRFGLGLTLAHQSLGQIPADVRDLIRATVGTQLYMATGGPDATALSADVVSPHYDREAARRLILGQKQGEAFLARLGRESVRIRMPLAPDPAPGPAAVAALRAAALAAYGRTVAEIDAEIAARIPGPAAAPAAPAAPAAAAGSAGSAAPPAPPAPPAVTPAPPKRRATGAPQSVAESSAPGSPAPAEATAVPAPAATAPPPGVAYTIRHGKLRSFARKTEGTEGKEGGGSAGDGADDA